MSDAAAIYQAYLDHASEAFWSADWEELARCWAYPHRISASGLIQDVTCAAELKEAACVSHESMNRLGATAMHRVCLEASFYERDPGRIDGLHRVYLLRGGSYAHPPYESRITLRLRRGRWIGAHLSSSNDIAKLTTIDPKRAVRLT